MTTEGRQSSEFVSYFLLIWVPPLAPHDKLACHSPSPLSLLAILIMPFLSLSNFIFFFRDKFISWHPQTVWSWGNGFWGGGAQEKEAAVDQTRFTLCPRTVKKKKSSVIKSLNPNQQFHIRNPSRMFLRLIAVPLSFCTGSGDTRFVLADGNRWACIVRPRLYANVNPVSPDPEAWPDRVCAFYTTRLSLVVCGGGGEREKGR